MKTLMYTGLVALSLAFTACKNHPENTDMDGVKAFSDKEGTSDMKDNGNHDDENDTTLFNDSVPAANETPLK